MPHRSPRRSRCFPNTIPSHDRDRKSSRASSRCASPVFFLRSCCRCCRRESPRGSFRDHDCLSNGPYFYFDRPFLFFLSSSSFPLLPSPAPLPTFVLPLFLLLVPRCTRVPLFLPPFVRYPVLLSPFFFFLRETFPAFSLRFMLRRTSAQRSRPSSALLSLGDRSSTR